MISYEVLRDFMHLYLNSGFVYCVLYSVCSIETMQYISLPVHLQQPAQQLAQLAAVYFISFLLLQDVLYLGLKLLYPILLFLCVVFVLDYLFTCLMPKVCCNNMEEPFLVHSKRPLLAYRQERHNASLLRQSSTLL